MEHIGIVGFGLIGRAWAVVFARAGHEVTVHDADPSAIEAGLGWIDAALADLAAAGLLADEPATVRARIRAAAALEDAVAGAAYVQESAGETLDIKRALFAALDRLAPVDAILASSTSSTIPASTFSGDLAGRARCLVAHPVNPVHLIPVVELAPAPWTSPDVIARTRDLQRRIGQSPVVLVQRDPGLHPQPPAGGVVVRGDHALGRGHRLGRRHRPDGPRRARPALVVHGPARNDSTSAAPGGVVDAAARYGGPFLEIARKPDRDAVDARAHGPSGRGARGAAGRQARPGRPPSARDGATDG